MCIHPPLLQARTAMLLQKVQGVALNTYVLLLLAVSQVFRSQDSLQCTSRDKPRPRLVLCSYDPCTLNRHQLLIETLEQLQNTSRTHIHPSQGPHQS